MRFLIDNNLPPRFAAELNELGHDSAHVRDALSPSADDEVIMAAALAQKRVVVAQDTDFGTILATTGAKGPSWCSSE